MRDISAASLAKLVATSNVKPVIVLRVYWADTVYTSYADRKYDGNGLIGRLIAISGIEDVVDINASATSTTLSVTLDDCDGSIKNIFNYNDIHKTFVQVMQWFEDIPLSDAFILFEGEISSPIVWSEGDRTLKFDVVSILEDREVGFSAEEAQFNYMPTDLVGKAWPIVFGTVSKLKPLAINQAPSAILGSGFGIVNEDAWDAELTDISNAINAADKQARAAYALGSGEAIRAGFYKNFGPGNFPEDPQQADQHDQTAAGYFAQSGKYAEEIAKLQLEFSEKSLEREAQEALQFRFLPIVQSNLPAGPIFSPGDQTLYLVEIGNYVMPINVSADGRFMHIVEDSSQGLGISEKQTEPNAKVGTNNYDFGEIKTQYTSKNADKQKFVWIDGGTTIRVYNFPVQYIVSLGTAQVLNVWAQSKYGRAIVPPAYYIVSYGGFQNLAVTFLTIPVPLTSLQPDFWQDGEIEVDVQNNFPGTNTVDIMAWAITNFSGLTYDPVSFNQVRTKVSGFPANFALTDRKNVVTFLKDVAFQSRCAIWLKNRTFYLQFLPEDNPAVESITDSDVEVNTLVITSTETERLVTKFVAQWRYHNGQEKPDEIILRYNVKNYGSIEETYDFYIYNQYEAVAKAAEFWMIRKSNTWKLIQCKVALNKLRIESFDYVNFTFAENVASIGTIKGQITKSTFNPDDDSLNIEAWLPVRFGEMQQYAYAFPGTTQLVYPPLDDGNILTGNPYENSHITMPTGLSFPTAVSFTTAKRNPPTQGSGGPANQSPGNNNLITALSPSEILGSRPAGLDTFNNATKRTIAELKQATTIATTANVFYGAVVSKTSDFLYRVLVYVKGFTKDPTELDVKIGRIREGTVLPEGFPLSVNRTTWAELDPSDNKTYITKFEYWAQPAIWVAPLESDADDTGSEGGGLSGSPGGPPIDDGGGSF